MGLQLKLLAGALTASAYISSTHPILNDSPRNFYACDTQDTVVGEPQQQISQPEQKQGSATSTKGAFLEPYLAQLRTSADRQLARLKQTYIEKSDAYFAKERHVTDTLSALHDHREPLVPNSIYILTGFLTGSVLTRKRGILLRATLPLFTGIVAFKMFMPSTFARTSAFLTGVEKEKLPAVYRRQEQLGDKQREIVEKSAQLKQQNEQRAGQLYDKTRKAIGELTGLNVDQEVTTKTK